jgi:rifampicin phosphotransferase
VDGEVWREWRSRFQAHLDRYGHAVYNVQGTQRGREHK